MTNTWSNDCQVPTSGTIDSTNTGTGTNIVNGGTNNAVAAAGAIGAGNTFTPDTTSLPTVTGLTIARCWYLTQNGANQLTEYADGASGQTHFKWFSLFWLDAAPAASLTHLRFYTNTSHATIAASAQITTTRKVHVSEQGGSTSTDSTGVLAVSTWYLEAFEYDSVGGTLSITYYPIGSTTPVATSTLSSLIGGPYSIISARFGIGTASAFTSQGFKRCLITMGDGAVTRPDPTNVDYVASPSDPVGFTDAVTVVQTTARTVADPVGLTDTGAGQSLDWGITVNDPIGVTDSASQVAALVRSQADPVGITDAASAGLSLSGAPADPLGFTDSVTVVQTTNITVSDPVGVTDATGTVVAAQQTVSDSIGLSDSVSGVLTSPPTPVYFYTPPLWRNVATMEGSLRYGIPTSTVVYRQDGVWYNILTAGVDLPVVLDCDVWVDPRNAANTLRLFFCKPMVVPGALHDELAALAPADPSWTPGTLTLL